LLLYDVTVFNIVYTFVLSRFPKLSDQFFDKAPWPSDKEVRTIMDDDKVL